MTTGGDEHAPLARIQPSAVCKFLLHDMCQRQIKIIAAQQQMIAHRNAMELQTATFPRSHVNQAEVRCAATDVAHQDCLAGRHDLVPFVAVCIHPGIERGLRFFQQHDSRQPGNARGGDSQFPSDFIE